jgi:hypothetical protein
VLPQAGGVPGLPPPRWIQNVKPEIAVEAMMTSLQRG